MNASFCKRSKAYLFLFLEPRIKQRVSQRNLHCLLRVLKNLFPNSSSVTLKERDTVNSTANLSTWTQLTNQCMTPESVIMERRHQRHVPSPFPLPRPLPGSLSLQIFDHVFCLFPLLWGLVPGYLSRNLLLAWQALTALIKEWLDEWLFYWHLLQLMAEFQVQISHRLDI